MTSRIFSSIGVNHLVLKGINGQPIFLDNEDKIYFLNLLNSKLSKNFILISYCLMSNHVHLLIKENTSFTTSDLMRNFISYYAKWFNAKHERSTSLFKQKFYSEGVESEIQLINVIKYIHNNPVKACIVDSPEKYPWSSYKNYLSNKSKIVDVNYIEHYNISKSAILTNENPKFYSTFDDSELYFKSYDCIFDSIEKYLNGSNIFDLLKMNSTEQHKLIKYLILDKNFSQRKIAKIFNFSIAKISKILNE